MCKEKIYQQSNEELVSRMLEVEIKESNVSQPTTVLDHKVSIASNANPPVFIWFSIENGCGHL
jgi:hypothetical protein